MQKIKNIILDYGDVIFMIDFARARQAFITLGVKNIDELFGHKGQHKLFDDLDCGKITAAQFRDGIRQITAKLELTDAQIDHAWNALLIGVPEGNHEILEQLNKKYRLFLLSNNNEIHYQWIMEHLSDQFQLSGNSQFFEKDYYSHLMGMRKPNKEIFTYVIDKHALNPAETLFIDDSPQHIETANGVGLHTALLTKPDTLRELIKRLEIL